MSKPQYLSSAQTPACADFLDTLHLQGVDRSRVSEYNVLEWTYETVALRSKAGNWPQHSVYMLVSLYACKAESFFARRLDLPYTG
jgi:hypothetical protein